MEDIERARVKYKDKLTVRFGVELGQPHLYPESSSKVLGSYDHDFVLGSVHRFSDGSDACRLHYQDYTCEHVCMMYFKELKGLLEWGNFDCLGHIDLIKRYSSSCYKKRITFMDYIDYLDEILKMVISNGKAIEINASGLRRDCRETLPGFDVVKRYKELGGEYLTVGSDSHKIEDVGSGIEEALRIAVDAGFQYITVYDKRTPYLKKIF